MRSLRIAVLLVAMALPAVALASGAGRQAWVTNCNKEQYKPRMIVISCGDGGIVLKDLKWSRWTATKAMGRGTEWVKDCTPNCATGHYVKTPATVTLTKRIRCTKRKHPVFDRLTMKFHGVMAPETHLLGCPF
jgi:hypothetical protein